MKKTLMEKIIVKTFNWLTVIAVFGIFISVCAIANAWEITTPTLATLLMSSAWIGFYAYLNK